MSVNNPCKCAYCKTVKTTQVAGDDLAIKRDFDRIERNQKIINLGDKLEAIDHLTAKQAKTPSATTDGV